MASNTRRALAEIRAVLVGGDRWLAEVQPSADYAIQEIRLILSTYGFGPVSEGRPLERIDIDSLVRRRPRLAAAARRLRRHA